MAAKCGPVIKKFFVEFEADRSVAIPSKLLGIGFRVLQITFLVILIVLVFTKRVYQEFDDVEGVVTTKVKGVVYTNLTGLEPETDRLYNHKLYDVIDYVVPPLENNAFFVTTNLIITENQTRGMCDEDPTKPNVTCTTNVDCPEGAPVLNGNGVRTGRCVTSSRGPGRVCEIHAWCPVEHNELPLANMALLEGSKNFTVLLKNSIGFPKFNTQRNNMKFSENDHSIQTCHYSPADPLCPVFQLDYIAQAAGQNYSQMSVQGAVISIMIHWDCDLNQDVKHCLPVYTFRRLDLNNSNGFNFRYAHYFEEGGVVRRTMIKAYGIRFLLKVTGQGGRFDPIRALMGIGSFVGLFSLATVACQCIASFTHKRYVYHRLPGNGYISFLDPDDPEKNNISASNEASGLSNPVSYGSHPQQNHGENTEDSGRRFTLSQY